MSNGQGIVLMSLGIVASLATIYAIKNRLEPEQLREKVENMKENFEEFLRQLINMGFDRVKQIFFELKQILKDMFYALKESIA